MATPVRTVRIANNRVQNFYEYQGREVTVMELSRECRVSYASLLLRLAKPDTTVEDALTTPPMRGPLGTGKRYAVRGESLTATQIYRDYKIRPTFAYFLHHLKAGRGVEWLIHKYGES